MCHTMKRENDAELNARRKEVERRLGEGEKQVDKKPQRNLLITDQQDQKVSRSLVPLYSLL